MQFIRSNDVRPSSAAVIHNGKVLETVLVGMTPGESKPVAGGAGAEMREIFRQLDEILAEAGLERTHICSARIYLQDVLGEVGEINAVWKEYFGTHPPNRRCYGVQLQVGLRVEAGFVAEFPEA
jgi:enamine deaminase RidA (YjgF/YER057c/UK114 family)